MSDEWRDTLLRIARERLSRHRHPEALAEAMRVVPRSLPFEGMTELESLDVPALIVASHDEADPGPPLLGRRGLRLEPARCPADQRGGGREPARLAGGQALPRDRRLLRRGSGPGARLGREARGDRPQTVADAGTLRRLLHPPGVRRRSRIDVAGEHRSRRPRVRCLPKLHPSREARPARLVAAIDLAAEPRIGLVRAEPEAGHPLRHPAIRLALDAGDRGRLVDWVVVGGTSGSHGGHDRRMAIDAKSSRAGVGSVFPLASVARTSKRWPPGARPP